MSVTTSMIKRNLLPSSPLKVPGSSDRVMANQTPSESDVPESEGPMPLSQMIPAISATKRAVNTPSHSSTIQTPRARALSMR